MGEVYYVENAGCIYLLWQRFSHFVIKLLIFSHCFLLYVQFAKFSDLRAEVLAVLTHECLDDGLFVYSFDFWVFVSYFLSVFMQHLLQHGPEVFCTYTELILSL